MYVLEPKYTPVNLFYYIKGAVNGCKAWYSDVLKTHMQYYKLYVEVGWGGNSGSSLVRLFTGKKVHRPSFLPKLPSFSVDVHMMYML